MSRIITPLIFVAALGTVSVTACKTDPAPPAPTALRFGAPIVSKAAPTPLSAVLAAPEKHAGPIKLRGRVESVCQKKGCWMVLKEGGPASVRIRFKDYAFFVPNKTVAGTLATCEGTLAIKTIDEATAKHYAGETPGGNPDAIKGPTRELEMIASGVELVPPPGAPPPAAPAKAN
jgi:hypothetical protein